MSTFFIFFINKKNKISNNFVPNYSGYKSKNVEAGILLFSFIKKLMVVPKLIPFLQLFYRKFFISITTNELYRQVYYKQ